MSVIAVLLLVALLIPSWASSTRRSDGHSPGGWRRGARGPPALDDLVKKVDLLEAEVDDLTRSVQALQDENTFLQRLLTESSPARLSRPPA